MLQVEEMRAEYAKQVEKEEQLVKLEDETASDWDLHSEFCPHKVREPASDWDLHSEFCPHKWRYEYRPATTGTSTGLKKIMKKKSQLGFFKLITKILKHSEILDFFFWDIL